ncbi:MAG: restriction endonuclease [Chloroflexi bacterium]|nr:restriction endonuclease [Chloroflexota bacterium]
MAAPRIAYNPDVLSCLANLSSDEVFTPPKVVNDMLDLLPPELFRSPETTFLDPATKTGVFLREIAKRLIVGLEDTIPDLQERVDHIFQRQLYGIAITEITSLMTRRTLYGSKYPNSIYSLSAFENAEGNIHYQRQPHQWLDGRCVFCGASQSQYDRPEELESHAYAFLHTVHPERIFDMKFDVIIGNPPYQLSDGGNKASAKPIYQLFVEQSMKLKPRFISFIIPARWYSGGKGLRAFRTAMLNDNRIRALVDYPNSTDCFPGVDVAGGICYFLWDRDHRGLCEFTSIFNNNSVTVCKELNEFDTFIRHPMAENIIRKVLKTQPVTMDKIVSARKPFGLATNVRPEKGDLLLRYNKGTGPFPIEKVTSGKELINKWKVMISYLSSEHAGKPDKNGMYRVLSTIELLPPKTICSETYLIAGAFDTENDAWNMRSYLLTRFARFLVSQIAVSQHITREAYSFVPMQDFSKPWSDAELYAKYGLDEDEIAFIESMIRPMEASDD